MVCPNPRCKELLGLGEDALVCPKCPTLDHRPPSTGLYRSREARALAEQELFALAECARKERAQGEDDAPNDSSDPLYVYEPEVPTEDEDDEEEDDDNGPARTNCGSLQALKHYHHLLAPTPTTPTTPTTPIGTTSAGITTTLKATSATI